METQSFYFARATCPSGAGGLMGLFRSMRGVSDVAVKYEEGVIEVTFDPTETTVDEIIETAAAEMGLRLSTEMLEGGNAETC